MMRFADALVDAKKQRICLDEEIDKKREASMNDYDPFGKPGAGAPNIDEHGLSKVCLKM